MATAFASSGKEPVVSPLNGGAMAEAETIKPHLLAAAGRKAFLEEGQVSSALTARTGPVYWVFMCSVGAWNCRRKCKNSPVFSHVLEKTGHFVIVSQQVG